MRELRYATLWLALGWLLVLVVTALTLSPKPLDKELGLDFNDKLGHLLAYGVLMYWFCLVYVERGTLLRYLIAFLLLGTGLEYLQRFGGSRYFEVADMLANALGVGIGLLLGASRLGEALIWVESRLVRPR